MAIKFLVSGYEASGKSTLTSTIKDALVINFDKKEYTFECIHANFKDYHGMEGVIDFIMDKLKSYKDKFNKYPKYLVLDTITQLYSAMTRYNSVKYTGFKIHEQNNIDTLDLNTFLEDTVIANDISVIIVAHTIVDEKSSRHIIPAQGQFAKAGSWHSVTNESLFIEKSSGKLIVYLKDFNYPARTTLKDIEKHKLPIDEFDINKHLDRLTNSKSNVEKFIL